MCISRTFPAVISITLLITGITTGDGSKSHAADVSSGGHGIVKTTEKPAAEDPMDSLFEMSLDELMALKVISVAKRPQPLSESPAAVFVITAEDIRRSGATCVPEALRLAPGVHVGRIDGNKWAIAIRGFNSRFTNKLLVLMDGRSVYTPIFGGVYWDVQDTLMADIDRIEVIRGPGGTQWGANAVSGVINIITKNSRETQGGLLTLGGGSEERFFGGFRYGGRIGKNACFRIYTKYFDRDDQAAVLGGDASDEWDAWRTGFRMDWDLSAVDALTFQGDYYEGNAGRRQRSASRSDTTDISGGNLLGRWEHVFSKSSNLFLQIYYDRTERRDDSIAEDRNTLDVDFQHRFSPFDRHDLIWGFGYRYTRDDTDDPGPLSLDPSRRGSDRFSVFLQDEITLVEKKLFLMLGSKFEHNDYSGYEYQPSIRLSWIPNDRHTLWAAVSRAIRTPSRMEHDQRVSIGPMVVVEGKDGVDSEKLIAYELGYRFRPLEAVFVDIATFYNVYDDLLTTETDGGGPASFANKRDGKSYGIELFINWTVTDAWKLMFGYSFLKEWFDLDASSSATFTELDEADPQHLAHIRTNLNLPYNFEFDAGLYYVDNVLDHPSYFRFDVRFGWRPAESLDISIVLQNDFDPEHPEFSDAQLEKSEVERSLFAKLTWTF